MPATSPRIRAHRRRLAGCAGPRRARPRRAAGFTLIEMMFALVLGAIALSAMYTVVGGSTRLFYEQHRVSRMQLVARRAMHRLTRDVQRAGFLATPGVGAPGNETCGPLGGGLQDTVGTMRFAGISHWGEDIAADTGLNMADNDLTEPQWAGAAVPGGGNRADTLTLLGNYQTGAHYGGIKLFADNQTIAMDSTRHAFHRDFTNWAIDAAPVGFNADAFAEAFAVGRAIRLEARSGLKHFAVVTAILPPGTCTPDASAWAPPCIRFTPAVPLRCQKDMAGGWVAPLSFIRYRVRPGEDAEAAPQAAVTGVNSQLQRVEIDPTEPTDELLLADGVTRANSDSIADFVAFFNVMFIPNLNNLENQTDRVDRTQLFDPNANPERVRSVILELAVRSSISDMRFPWVEPTDARSTLLNPLQRYLVFTPPADGSRAPATRVRYARAEVFVPNIALGGY